MSTITAGNALKNQLNTSFLQFYIPLMAPLPEKVVFTSMKFNN